MPREVATVTTTELARKLGVHRNTILLWLAKGVLVPDIRTYCRWARWRPSSIPRIRRRLRERERRAA